MHHHKRLHQSVQGGNWEGGEALLPDTHPWCKWGKESNAVKSWVIRGEMDIIIEYITELSSQGLPVSHCWLKEHVQEILWAWLGDKFPASCHGLNFPDLISDPSEHSNDFQKSFRSNIWFAHSLHHSETC